jgi:hypothetical protein
MQLKIKNMKEIILVNFQIQMFNTQCSTIFRSDFKVVLLLNKEQKDDPPIGGRNQDAMKN